MIRAFVLAILAMGFAAPVFAQDQQKTDEELAAQFTINNSTYVLYHEIGHMLIGELGIPVLAREEDAADNLASLLLLNAQTVEADTALIDAADGWFLTDSLQADTPYDDAEFYDEHSLDLQRAFQIVCLMVGADAEVFGDVASEYGIDGDRQERCAGEYENTSESWSAVLEPFTLEDGASRPEVQVIYEEPKDNGPARDLLMASGILDAAADGILKYYDLQRPVQLRGTDCGEENAFYDPQAGEVVFCYELVNFYYGLFFYDPEAPQT